MYFSWYGTWYMEVFSSNVHNIKKKLHVKKKVSNRGLGQIRLSVTYIFNIY